MLQMLKHHAKSSSSLFNAPAFLQVLQHQSNTSVSPPHVLQHPSNVPPSPKKFQNPPKYSSISQKIPAPPKGSSIPTTPSPGAATPCPTHCPTLGSAPRCLWRCHNSAGGEGLVLRTPGSRDTATGGRYEVSLVPCPQPLSRCGAGAGVPAGGCRPGSGPDPAAGRRVRTSGRREEGQVQGKMPSSWKRPSPPRLGWNKPQHPSCAAAAPGRGN